MWSGWRSEIWTVAEGMEEAGAEAFPVPISTSMMRKLVTVS